MDKMNPQPVFFQLFLDNKKTCKVNVLTLQVEG